MINQTQKPTLAFLIRGMLLAGMGSKFESPERVYKFIVILLLLKVGIGAGISVRAADLLDLAVPALATMKGVSHWDDMATAGLFGTVSASTLAAGMSMLDGEWIACEGFIGALYPFMDVAALVTAIVMAKLAEQRRTGGSAQGDTMTLGGPAFDGGMIKTILKDTFQSAAFSARADSVYASFYEPLFLGLLSIMGMEAWSRLSELRGVAHAYIAYGLLAPVVHGLLGFGVGILANQITGFSASGTVLLAMMAASSSDISGPPTMCGALPKANPSAYVGTSTGLGTSIAILSIPVCVALADRLIGF